MSHDLHWSHVSLYSVFDDSGNFLLYATMIGVKGGCGHVLVAVWQSDSFSLSFSDQSRHQQMRQDHRKGASS